MKSDKPHHWYANEMTEVIADLKFLVPATCILGLLAYLGHQGNDWLPSDRNMRGYAMTALMAVTACAGIGAVKTAIQLVRLDAIRAKLRSLRQPPG